MRILFICGNLEAGRDGVGDQMRLLAQECSSRGHACALLAYHDRFVTAVTEAEEPLPLLRLPSVLPWRERSGLAACFAAKVRAEWCSVQFVPYAFHDRGLCVSFLRALAPLVAGRKLQILFHELWIGANAGAAWRERATGWLQRQIILGWLKRFRPASIAATNTTYVAMLEREGFRAAHLPLFGSIPIVPHPAKEWLFQHCATQGLGITAENRGGFLILGLFAALYPGWPAEPLFTSLRAAGAATGRQVVLASIGRMGAGEAVWRDLAGTYQGALLFLRCGEQPEERVSAFLQWIDYGISTVSWELTGKSSSVAALLEHGVPVIVNRDDWHLRLPVRQPAARDPRLWRADEALPARLATEAGSGERRSGLPEVAARFLASLAG